MISCEEKYLKFQFDKKKKKAKYQALIPLDVEETMDHI